MAQRQPFRTPSIAGRLSSLYLENERLYLDYMNNLSPLTSPDPIPAALPMDNNPVDNISTSTNMEPYEIRTLNENNMARKLVLPAFPLDSLKSSTTTTAVATTDTSSETVHLLLANVWVERLTDEQFDRTRPRTYVPLFRVGMATNVTDNAEVYQTCLNNSHMWDFYQKLYVNTRKRFKVDISLIDYNWKRMNACLETIAAQYDLHRTTLTWDEMVLAFEFYLQIDVDLFFLKTCSFNNVEPRVFDDRYREGLFCIDIPEARFAITPCNKRYCTCCHPPCLRRHIADGEQTQAVCFSIPHIHQFVNGYEAILNCPATCETTDCVYVLTCPCGKYDYIGATSLSFAQALTYHREEGNRIIREFFFGTINTEYLTHGLKSERKRINDASWLYQHSTRCPSALQIFLDENPDYWCFVPTRIIGINLMNTAFERSSLSRRSSIDSPSLTLIDDSLRTRDHHEVRHLVQNIPKPPSGFTFSVQQRQQQAQFFQQAKECIVPRDLPDLYNANIIAVLPAQSSELLRTFVESLFITHTECQLNQKGNLVYEKTDPNRTLINTWCTNLTRRLFDHI